jgi:2-phospho-L-lactate guanylyltransferase
MPGTGGPEVWVAVLIKDFGAAKTRLRPALEPAARRNLARRNAHLALAAAAAGDHVLAVCGSREAADLAAPAGAEVLLEDRPSGQNAAARLALDHAAAGGAGAVLLLSSDLPLVTRDVVAGMLAGAGRMAGRAVVAAPATGRGGTNALFMRPPGVIDPHFGDDSLAKFQSDSSERGVPFALFESSELALDLDEPADLEALARR